MSPSRRHLLRQSLQLPLLPPHRLPPRCGAFYCRFRHPIVSGDHPAVELRSTAIGPRSAIMGPGGRRPPAMNARVELPLWLVMVLLLLAAWAALGRLPVPPARWYPRPP